MIYISILAILQGILGMLDGIRSARHIRTFRPRSAWKPRIVVFCPCKGKFDAGLSDNIRSILNQDYPSFRAVFIVESDDDPACVPLRDAGATILVAGLSTIRGQKVHNLIHAVEHAAGDTEVFVFCDSDAQFPRTWISDLIAPLEDDTVGVSTGYRWYMATRSLPTLFRSIWNASVVTALGPHSRNFAWGGSMAIRRSVFDRIRVLDAWDRAVSDDFAVTLAARAAGMRIVFVPTCLIPSYGECTWRELLEFTTRQIIITRVYEPALWRLAFVGQTIFNVTFWWAFARMWTHPAAAAIWLAVYALSAIKAAVRVNAVSTVLPSGALSKYRLSYILLAPLGSLLYEYNMLRSAGTRDILWRQRRYSLISPQHTIVRSGDGRSSTP